MTRRVRGRTLSNVPPSDEVDAAARHATSNVAQSTVEKKKRPIYANYYLLHASAVSGHSHEAARWPEEEISLLSYLARSYLTVWARLMRHILDACQSWRLF